MSALPPRIPRAPFFLGLLTGLVGLAGPTSAAGDGYDERAIVGYTETYPWHLAVKVKLGPNGGLRGSGGLIAPCTILTNGHVVWNGKSEDWSTIQLVAPGSYYDDVNDQTGNPYGTQPPLCKATNTKYIDTLKNKYDYGAIFVASSFADLGIDTYMPVAVGEKPDFINLAGYPTEELPLTGNGMKREQWHAFGETGKFSTRELHYEAESTGGASGSPVWVYYPATEERYLVAVNQGSSDDWDGRGVRIINKNEDIIAGWMNEPCVIGGNGDDAGDPLPTLTFRALLDGRKTLRGLPLNVPTPLRLGLVDPPANRNQLTPYRTLLQIIEGTFYRWQEFRVGDPYVPGGLEGHPPDGHEPPTRFLRLVEPESRWLSAEEAAVLLTASRLWMRPATATNPVMESEDEAALEAVEAPVPRDVFDDPDAPELEVRSAP